MADSIKRIVQAVFGLRRGERGLALLMTLYHFLLLNTLYLLKPVRDSLFLSKQGPLELPFVFMLTTVAVIPVVALHARAGRKMRLSRLINGVSLVLVANLVALRWLVSLDVAWVYYLFYAWVSIYAVLVTSQFWLLANALFNATEAKRTFTLLSFGAILGSVTGGEITGLLVDELGMRTENLIWLCAALLAGSVVLVNLIRYRSRRRGRPSVNETPRERAAPGLKGVLRTLRSSRHLLLIVGIIGLMITATTLIDYQFKTVAAGAYPSEDALTSFMGRFYGRVSLVALVLQLTLAPRLIRMLGVGGALSLLPIGLALGSVGLLVAPGLIAATALRGIDQSLRHSIDKTGRELLFVPVDLEKKRRVKVFIDLFVEQGTQGLGGVLLLFFTLILGVGVQYLTLVVLGLLGLWLVLIALARSSYINQFRTMLRHQDEEDKAQEAPTRRMSFEELLRSLQSRSRTEVVQGLERLEEKPAQEVPAEAVCRLLDHESAEVRRLAIRVLRLREVGGLTRHVAPHLEDADADVRLEAARYLYRHLNGDRDRLLEQGLHHADVRIRSAAVGLIAKDGGPEERALLTEPMLRALMEHDGEAAEEARLQVARVLSVVDFPARNDLLRTLMDDEAPAVAERAIKSAGQTGDRWFVPFLLEHLKESEHVAEARRSLAAYGARILGTLYDHLIDEQVDPCIRRRIPSILAKETSQAAVDVLLLSLGRVTVPVGHAVVRALSKLRAHDQTFQFRPDAVHKALHAEMRRYAALGRVLHVYRQTGAEDTEPVTEKRLCKVRRQSLERLFRLLGLIHNQDDVYSAYRGLTSGEEPLRTSAVELMDNLLEWDTKKHLLPLLEDLDGALAPREAPELLDRRIRRWPEALAYLLASNDPRLIGPALKNAPKHLTPEVRRAIQKIAHRAAPDLRQAARRLLEDTPEPKTSAPAPTPPPREVPKEVSAYGR